MNDWVGSRTGWLREAGLRTNSWRIMRITGVVGVRDDAIPPHPRWRRFYVRSGSDCPVRGGSAWDRLVAPVRRGVRTLPPRWGSCSELIAMGGPMRVVPCNQALRRRSLCHAARPLGVLNGENAVDHNADANCGGGGRKATERACENGPSRHFVVAGWLMLRAPKTENCPCALPGPRDCMHGAHYCPRVRSTCRNAAGEVPCAVAVRSGVRGWEHTGGMFVSVMDGGTWGTDFLPAPSVLHGALPRRVRLSDASGCEVPHLNCPPRSQSRRYPPNCHVPVIILESARCLRRRQRVPPTMGAAIRARHQRGKTVFFLANRSVRR